MKFLTVPCVHICNANYFWWHLSKRWTKTHFLGDLAAFSIAYKLLPVASLPQGRLKRNSDGKSEVRDCNPLAVKKISHTAFGRTSNLEVIDMPARLNIDARLVAELYEQGFSTPKIGRMLGYSKNPVVRRLHELGIRLRGKRIDVDVKRMSELYEQGFTSRKIARALGCSKTTVLRRLRKVGVRLRQNTRELPDLKPCRDLAYVLGVAFGDGKKRDDGLHLWVRDRDFAEAFAEACERLGFKPKRYFKENEGTYEVCVYSTEFGHWLKSLSYEMVKRLLADEDSKKAFVRGYFDSDGCATVNPAKPCRNAIAFGDPNSSLLWLVAKICFDLGIKTSIYGPYRRSGKRTFPRGGTYIQKKSMYVLYVHAKSKRRFSELIGSSLTRKREVLERIARFYS